MFLTHQLNFQLVHQTQDNRHYSYFLFSNVFQHFFVKKVCAASESSFLTRSHLRIYRDFYRFYLLFYFKIQK